MTTNFDSDSPKKKFTLVETDSVIDQDLKGVKSVGKSTSVDRIWSDIVTEWRPQSETFFLRWGSFILPQISILTAYEVARNAFQLNRVSVIGRSKKFGQHSKLTVIAWSFGLSLPISFMTNRFLVLEDILLQKSQCSTCNISRGMGLNLLTATILPGVLSGSGANLITARPAGFTMVEGMRKTIIRSRGIILASAVLNLALSFKVIDMMEEEWHYINLQMAAFAEASKIEEEETQVNSD